MTLKSQVLQWGRNFIVAEILFVVPPLYMSEVRFNGAATLSLRKSRLDKQVRVAWVVLQWGRNFIVAEILVNDATFRFGNSLQWGRNFIVAEIGSNRDWQFACRIGFNGAATLSLRKFRLSSSRKDQLLPCFNGAATLSLRKFLSHSGLLAGGASFNGAATLSLRKCKLTYSSDLDCVPLQWGRNFIVAEMAPWGR